MDRWMGGWMDRWGFLDKRWMDEWWMDGWRWVHGQKKYMNGRIDAWMHRWTDGWEFLNIRMRDGSIKFFDKRFQQALCSLRVAIPQYICVCVRKERPFFSKTGSVGFLPSRLNKTLIGLSVLSLADKQKFLHLLLDLNLHLLCGWGPNAAIQNVTPYCQSESISMN